MNDRLNVLSYTLAALAGVCFASGLAIISGGRVKQHGQIGDHHIHVR